MLVVMMNTVLYANVLLADNKLKKAVQDELNDVITAGVQKKVNNIDYFVKN